MAKNSVRDFDATAANNTDIQSVDIAENCAPSGINNAIRELMADIKDVSAGTVALESPSADSLTVTGEILAGTDTGDAFNAHAKLRVQKADHAYLQIKSANTKQAGVLLGDTDDDFVGGMIYDNSTNHLQFNSGDAERMRIDSSGNVGIGLTDPDTPLEIQRGSSGNALKLSSDTDGASVFLAFEHQESGTKHVRGRIRAASNGVNGGLIFETGASSSTSERVRIDNAGDLFVSKTSQNVDTDGHELRADGVTVHTANGASPLFLNRRSSDGTVATFMRSGTTDGQINCVSGDIAIGTGDTALKFEDSTDAIKPFNVTTNGSRDNAIDLGTSGARFDDIYATNGTIQTSDQNEKQQIASLTDAEITAAKAISKLFKTYKWNDSVAENGDNARTHAGVIAQDVQSAMTDAGLDAGDYAFFISTTWWETQTDVPAVEAVEAQDAVYETQTDMQGNETQVLVTEAVEEVEAREAHTRTDIYNTADEAPEGATERTRLGIRYPELLAFIGAATEQRLTSIEARLTALEG